METATSPDGSLRLEVFCHPHERAAASYSLRLAGHGGEPQHFFLGRVFPKAPFQFGPGRTVRLTVRFDSHDVPVRADFGTRTFVLEVDPATRAEPFERLPDRLRSHVGEPSAPRGMVEKPTARRLLALLGECAGALLFAAACGWMLWSDLVVGKKGWFTWLGLAVCAWIAVSSFRELLGVVRAFRAR